MAFTQQGLPFLYDELSRRIVGVKNSDGSESFFSLENTQNPLVKTSVLTTSLDNGAGEIAFSRASANASVIDNAGLMHFCQSGEARFYGARRIYNAVSDTEALTTGWTLGVNTTKTTSNLKSPNHDRQSAWSIVRSSGSNIMLTLNSQSYRPGQWTFSAWVMGDGTQTYTIRIERSSDSAGASQTVTPAAGVWTRIAVAHVVLDTTNYRATLTNATGGAASFIVTDPQMEYTHGTSPGSPNDYVPRGVAALVSATYPAGVDGVRYFSTLNPWSLASGIATKAATATAIDNSVLKGLLVEPSATNSLWSSRDIGTAQFVLGDATAASAMGDSTLLGTGSIRKLEEVATTNPHRVGQQWQGTLPANGSILTVSCYVKAAERSIVYCGFRQKDGSTEQIAYFNIATMTVGTVTGTNAEAHMWKEGDLIRIAFSANAGTGASAPFARFGVTTNDNVTSYAGTLASGAWFGALQFEQAHVPSSYVGDTAANAGLTRAIESATLRVTDCPTRDVTFIADFTPIYRTNVANKDSWWYPWYAYLSPTFRFGLSLRPGVFGGANVGDEDDWAFDLYNGSTAWDGVNVISGVVAQPKETYRTYFSLANTVQTGNSNQLGFVGGTLATNAGSATQGLNTLPSTTFFVYFGRGLSTGAQRGPQCIKNFSIRSRAMSASDVATSLASGA